MKEFFKSCYICRGPAYLRHNHTGAICSACLKSSHRMRRWAAWDADPNTIWSDDPHELLLYFKSFAPKLVEYFDCDVLSADGSSDLLYCITYGGDNSEE